MSTTRRARRAGRPVRRGARLLGVLAVAGVTALSGCSFDGVASLPLPGGPDLGRNPATVKIEFANVLDLVPQSAVKVNDVSVGQVEKIEIAGDARDDRGWYAVVTVKVRRDVKLPDNAVATIGQTSLLGEKFVQLDAPKDQAPSGELGEGDLIPLSRTTRGTEIEEVLSAMSLLLNNGGLEQISTISHELQAAMSGREATIKSVLHRLETFTGTLDRNRAAITRALDSIDRLTGKLADERRTIQDTIDQTGPAIAVLDRNRADLTKMLVALDKLSRTTTHVINRSSDDLLANLKDLDKILRNLNKAGSDLPKSLETLITFPFPSTFENVIEGDYGNVHLRIDLDFESLAQNLFGGTDLEGLLGSGREMRNMLQVPNVTLPDTPLGVLPQGGGDSGGLPGLPGQGDDGGRGDRQGSDGRSRPGAAGPGSGDGGLQTLMMGSLS